MRILQFYHHSDVAGKEALDRLPFLANHGENLSGFFCLSCLNILKLMAGFKVA